MTIADTRPRAQPMTLKPPAIIPPPVFDESYRRILFALLDGPLATPELADRVGAERSPVAYRCKRLEEKFGLLTSDLDKSDRKIFFFPVTGEVMTRANHDRIMAIIARMKAENPDDPDAQVLPFHPDVRVWELTPAARQVLAGAKAGTPAPASKTFH
jgi:Winged helix-turn-helix DNA-binding